MAGILHNNNNNNNNNIIIIIIMLMFFQLYLIVAHLFFGEVEHQLWICSVLGNQSRTSKQNNSLLLVIN